MIERRVQFQIVDNYLKVPMDWNTQELCERATEKGGWIDIKISLPSRKKTSPENRLFHKLCTSLAMWMNTDLDTMKMFIKRYASASHGYDQVAFTANGHTIINPKSLTHATNDDMINKLIPTCYELGLDWGCPLEQPEDYNG